MADSKPHIIIGGSIIGLAIGWRLLCDGAEHVEIFEAGEAARSGAAWVAAGMLSPRAEAGFEDLDIYEDGVKSLDLYPQFLDELRADVGELAPKSSIRCLALVLATNAAEARELDRQYDFRKRANSPVEHLSGDATREREPLLSTKVTRSLWLEQEAQINNRQLCLALKAAFIKRGGVLHERCIVSEIIHKERSRNSRSFWRGNAGCTKHYDCRRSVVVENCRNYSNNCCATRKRTNDRLANDARSAPEALHPSVASVSRAEGRWSPTRWRNGRRSGI